MKITRLLLFSLLPGLLWNSCENSGSISLDDNAISGVLMTDTITVETSTIYAGPVPTSNTNEMLVGSYHDSNLGKVSSRSYFRISPESSSFALNKDVVFDSIALIIRCSGYYYGDTTAFQTLNVFELQEEIEAEELPPNPEGVPVSWLLSGDQLYSSSHFDYDRSRPLASLRVRPEPSSDTLHIRLPDALGAEWLRLSAEDDDRISSAADFSDYFKGLVLAGSQEEDAALISYRADTSFVRLYYRETEDDGTIRDKFTDFPIYQPERQFNEITVDREGTPLEGIGPGSPIFPAAATSEETYLQAGTGIMTKLSFPYLKDFLEAAGDSSLSVHSAQLLIKPVTESITAEEYLPGSLMLFYTNEDNVPVYPVQDESSGGIYTGVFSYDPEFPGKTYYKFALTGYFADLLNNYGGQKAELLLSPATNDLYDAVTRLCIGSSRHKENKVQLIIYYTPGG